MGLGLRMRLPPAPMTRWRRSRAGLWGWRARRAGGGRRSRGAGSGAGRAGQAAVVYGRVQGAGVLAEADACTRLGGVGELLRREGLYTSHLTYWRKQRKGGALKELGKPRGRKPADTRDAQIAALTRRAERAESELSKARRVIEIQGNVSALLEEMLGEGSAQRSTER